MNEFLPLKLMVLQTCLTFLLLIQFERGFLTHATQELKISFVLNVL